MTSRKRRRQLRQRRARRAGLLRRWWRRLTHERNRAFREEIEIVGREPNPFIAEIPWVEVPCGWQPGTGTTLPPVRWKEAAAQ